MSLYAYKIWGSQLVNEPACDFVLPATFKYLVFAFILTCIRTQPILFSF